MEHKYEEVTLQSKPIYDGRIISLKVDQVRLPDGREATRELVTHPGATAVLAIEDNRMIVVEQYRKPLQRSIVEIPAGMLEPGEEPAAAAKRELKEETGYEARELKLLRSFYTSPGFADELIYLYYSDQLTAGAAKLDQDEFLDVHRITLEEAIHFMDQGKIADAKTIAAVYAWKLYSLSSQWM